MQNIGAANADDAFYRYKMPKLVAKIEGRGNGIKTNVVNNVDIAKALERPPEYVLKYYGCELGAQTNFDAKSGTSIVNGAHDTRKLNELLEGFIKKYVCCYSCNNPETQIKIKKDFIHLKCKACGFVSDVDMRHKLNTFILKNPPKDTLKKEEKQLKKAEAERLRDAEALGASEEKKKKKKDKDSSEKKDKDKKKKKKKEGEEGGSDGGDKSPKEDAQDDDDDEEEEDDDGVVWMTDTSAEAAKRRAEEQLTAATAAMVTVGNIEAEQEAARKKAEKKAAEEEARRKEEEERAAAEAADPVLRIRRMLQGKDAEDTVTAEIKSLTVEGGLAGKMRVLYEAAFGATNERLATVLTNKKAVFAAHAKDPQGQLAQLIAFEHVLGVSLPERSKEAALVLKTFYDLDLIEEDIIVAWANKADAGKVLGVPADAAKTVRKTVEPVVNWLQEEDSDEEDDEEDEEDDE